MSLYIGENSVENSCLVPFVISALILLKKAVAIRHLLLSSSGPLTTFQDNRSKSRLLPSVVIDCLPRNYGLHNS